MMIKCKTIKTDECWEASMNARFIVWQGATEHEATERMANGLLQLVADGCMDPSDPHRPMDATPLVGEKWPVDDVLAGFFQ